MWADHAAVVLSSHSQLRYEHCTSGRRDFIEYEISYEPIANVDPFPQGTWPLWLLFWKVHCDAIFYSFMCHLPFGFCIQSNFRSRWANKDLECPRWNRAIWERFTCTKVRESCAMMTYKKHRICWLRACAGTEPNEALGSALLKCLNSALSVPAITL